MEQLTPDDRIAAQEKAMDAVHCELALLRQQMDARFTSVDAQFASMRQYIDDAIAKLRLEMQLYTKEEIDKALAQLNARIDALRDETRTQFRWVIGLMASMFATMLALAARGLLF